MQRNAVSVEDSTPAPARIINRLHNKADIAREIKNVSKQEFDELSIIINLMNEITIIRIEAEK